jgi:hypothetical protein
VLTFLPYCFIAYMPRVPSRHTYFASVGLAVIVAAAFVVAGEVLGRYRRWAPAAVAAAMLLHNVGYLWIHKLEQYEARAEPTEALVKFGRSTEGPIYVKCFPYAMDVAQYALQYYAGHHPDRMRFAPSEALPGSVEFCYDRMP